MKTKSIVLSTLLALIMGFNALASGDELKKNKSVAGSYFSLEKQFQNKLESPFFISQQMAPQTVFIQFHVTNSFEVVIDNMVCEDVRLKSHIEKSLRSKIIMVDKDKVNKRYGLKMTFK